MYYLKQQVHHFQDNAELEAALISVVIPVYPAKSAQLELVIEQVKLQDYRRLEIIVVKNGAFEICSDADGKTLRTFEIERNVGAAYARNLGAKHARGEILWFVDSDLDSIKPDCAKIGAQTLAENPDIGIVGGIIFPTAEGNVLTIGRQRVVAVEGDETKIIDDDFSNTACAFVRTRDFKRIGGFADFIEYPFDDVDLGFKFRAAGFRCTGIAACSGVHPLHSGRASVFHEFMSFHNMLVHLFISYSAAGFAKLFAKKARQGFRLSPPSFELTLVERISALGRKLAGMCLAAPYLVLHSAKLMQLRRTRQAQLTDLQ